MHAVVHAACAVVVVEPSAAVHVPVAVVSPVPDPCGSMLSAPCSTELAHTFWERFRNFIKLRFTILVKASCNGFRQMYPKIYIFGVSMGKSSRIAKQIPPACFSR